MARSVGQGPSNKLSGRPLPDLIDVNLADEDYKLGRLCKLCKLCKLYGGGSVQRGWPFLAAPYSGQIWDSCKGRKLVAELRPMHWHHLVAEFATGACGAVWWPICNMGTYRRMVEKFGTNSDGIAHWHNSLTNASGVLFCERESSDFNTIPWLNF